MELTSKIEYYTIQEYDNIKLWKGEYSGRIYLRTNSKEVVVIAIEPLDDEDKIGQVRKIDDLNLVPFRGKVILEQE